MNKAKKERMIAATLSQRFIQLMRRVDAGPNLETFVREYRRLVVHYCMKSRIFHTPYRIASCIGEFDRVASCAHDPDAILMAIFYQHIEHNVRRINNAKESAKNFEFVALNALGLDELFVERVARMIRRSSINSLEQPESSDEKLFCDINCSILASPPGDYDRYVRELRQEYAYLNDNEWAIVRTANFLDKLLCPDAPEPIFKTPVFASREVLARANLMQERASLQ